MAELDFEDLDLEVDLLCGTPPHTVARAARAGDLEQIKQLVVVAGHPVDVADNRGWRPIHEAARGNYNNCLEYLLVEGGTDANWESFEGTTPLHMACDNKNLLAVQLLLEHGANPNAKDHMSTYPIHDAVRMNAVALVCELVGHGGRINVQNYCGTSPLHQAASEGYTAMVNVLLQHGAKLDMREEYDITPIFSAAQYGHTDCLKLLLEKAQETGEESLVDSRADDGASPLYLAAQEGHSGCVGLLLDHRADANVGPSQPRALPIHAALQFNHVKCVELLLPHTTVDSLAACDLSPFYFATSHKDTTCTDALLRGGISANLRHSADEEEFKPRILRYFMSSQVYSRWLCPLAQMTILHHPNRHASCLLRAGANVNAVTPYEVPPLLAALEMKNLELVELLISHGAAVNIYHPMIISNIAVLVARFHWRVLNLLLRCGAETDSLFLSSVPANRQLSIEQQNQARSQDQMDFSTDEVNEQEMGLLKAPVPLWRSMMDARASSAIFTQAEFLHRVLHFAGNVSIDPRLESSVNTQAEWKQIRAIGSEPRSLNHLCRRKIRSRFTPIQLFRKLSIQSLPLPPTVIDYLQYAELDT